MKQPLAQPSTQAGVWATQVDGGLRTVQKLIASLVCVASPSIAFSQTNRQLPREAQQTRPADTVHFANNSDCALCPSYSNAASAMRDGKSRNVVPRALRVALHPCRCPAKLLAPTGTAA